MVADPDRSTVADLARALGMEGPAPTDPGLNIDGRFVSGGTPVSRSGIAEGSEVVSGAADPPPTPLCLVAVGGPECGRRWPLPDGRHRLGRAWPCRIRLTDGHTSRVHAEILVAGDEVCVVDLGSTGGTSIDGHPVVGPTPLTPGVALQVGTTLAQLAPRVRPARAALPPGIDATPRSVGAPDPAPPPDPVPGDAAPSPPPTLSIAALIAPLAVGGMLALLYSPTLALLTAMGPALVMGSWLEARRRHRRATRAASEAAADAREAHHAAMADRARALSAVARAEVGTAAIFAARAASGRHGFWARGGAEAVVGWYDLEVGGRPETVDLHAGSVLVSGDRQAGLSIARHIVCQLATSVPPGRLGIDLDVDRPEGLDWGWARWLPHVRPGPGESATDRVVIVDRADPVGAPPGRGAVVLGATVDEIPPWCDRIVWAEPARSTGGVAPIGLDRDEAASVARLVARWRDPDAAPTGPRRVDLGHLLAGSVVERWSKSPAPRTVAAPIGRSVTGTVAVDLVADGPHALVAGTTGSGKSQLLQTLVVGLAASTSPSDLAFVLIDYKGGAAFDACARLPHVAGVVTDLDDGLLRRALLGLTAEVDRRERWLRACGLADLADAPRSEDRPPRLVVVVDEFAALARSEGDHLGTLVDLARRGRSLGLHLVLATQRPSGVVNDEIRANTDLRIALRLVDATDSVDLVGLPDAARLPGDRPGSALLSVAGSAPLPLQVADTSAPATIERAIEVGDRPPSAGSTQLAHLVDECVEAASGLGIGPAACPWPPALPARVDPDDLEADPTGIVIGLIDDVPGRRHGRVAWAPTTGPLCLHGGRRLDLSAAGTGALAALLAQSDRACAYVVDGDGALAPLLAAAPVVAVLGSSDGHDDLDRLVHRVSTTAEDGIILFIHRLDLLMGTLDDAQGLRAADRLLTAALDIGDRGAAVVVTSSRRSALPPTLRASGGLHVALHPVEEEEALLAGLSSAAGSDDPPGRGTTADGRVVQLCTLDPHRLRTARPSAGHAAPLLPLPDTIAAGRLPAGALGLADPGREPISASIARGDRFVITGPPGSGRTTALRQVARTLRGDLGAPSVITRRRDEWRDGLAMVTSVEALPEDAPSVVLVDDATAVDDATGRLAHMARRAVGDVTLVVTLDPVEWVRAHGHWTRGLAPARSGIALDHRAESEDPLWAVRLPPTPTEALPTGRGLLIAGGCSRPLQIAGE